MTAEIYCTYYYPTNIASVHLVVGCPHAGAGVTMGEEKGTPRATWSNPNFDPITDCH